VPRDGHYGLIASLGFGELRHSMVAKIVESKSRGRALHIAYVCFALFVLTLVTRVLLLAARRALNRPRQSTPSRSPACLRPSRVRPIVFAGGKQMVRGLDSCAVLIGVVLRAPPC